MAGYLPKFMPGSAITYTAQANITGGRLVEIAGERAVRHSAKDSAAVVGVASCDAQAGEQVTVYALHGTVHKLIANAAITAGDQLSAEAEGKAGAAGDNIIGLAISSAAAGSVVLVQG